MPANYDDDYDDNDEGNDDDDDDRFISVLQSQGAAVSRPSSEQTSSSNEKSLKSWTQEWAASKWTQNNNPPRSPLCEYQIAPQRRASTPRLCSFHLRARRPPRILGPFWSSCFCHCHCGPRPSRFVSESARLGLRPQRPYSQEVVVVFQSETRAGSLPRTREEKRSERAETE